jgi:hypothetical protein
MVVAGSVGSWTIARASSRAGDAVELVPPAHHDVSTMLMCRWTDLLWTRADLRGATAVLDAASREHLGGSYVIETSRTFVRLLSE